jgi:c(7)-type cytochrome triheme protein
VTNPRDIARPEAEAIPRLGFAIAPIFGVTVIARPKAEAIPRRSFALTLIASFVLALLAATASAAETPAPQTPVPRSLFPRSLAVFPAQRIAVRFNHKVHLEAGANCESCHDSATKSLKASDLNLPKAVDRPGTYPEHPDCDNCHDIDAAAKGKKTDPPAGCDYCHAGFDFTVQKEPPRSAFPDPNIIFPHKVHVDRKVDCQVCHQDMANVVLATRDQLPKMEVCLTCHDGRQAANACATCHVTGAKGGRILVSFANTPDKLRPMAGNPLGIDHGIRFDRNHGGRTMMEQNTCMECHADRECLACHDGLMKPLTVHPNDYITLHPIQARQDSVRCDACHRRQTFCAACHERVGVGWDADKSFQPKSNMRVHPPPSIWVNLPVTAGHHSLAATRDIESCVACHREETCESCHSNFTNVTNSSLRALSCNLPGGAQCGSIDPHPPGWATPTGTCGGASKNAASKNSRVCVNCHTAGELHGLGCI